MQIIESVPNFSEGKNKKIINAIVKAISISEIKILNVHSDPDHNRTVVTFLGEPEKVVKAAFQGVKKASQLIDLSKHKGVHPRIGAADVIPLIPIKDISEKECIFFAEKLGEKIGKELKIPVYLYEKAAKIPERKNLADIRKNGYNRKPDFGPQKAGPAGATVVGVRDILIAFNVNLAPNKMNNLKTAKSIAKKIREKNGGLKNVKAIGLYLKSRGIAQISMNLTNYKKTSLLRAFSRIEKLAKKHRIKILESEIVGMIPKDALPKNYKKILKLKNFKKKQILEIKKF